MILTTCVAPQVEISLKAGTKMQDKQPNTLLLNVHDLNCHLNPESTIITKDYVEKILKRKLLSQSFSNEKKT